MFADQCFLLRCLFQDTLGNNVGGGFLCNDQLREAVADVLQCICHETEARIIENLLLHTEDHAELGLGAHFTERPEEFKVKNNLPLISGRQVRQELIDYDQIALVRILFGEGHHHILDYRLEALYAAVFGCLKSNAATVKIVLNIAHDDIIERHHDTADFNTEHFKLSGNRLYLLLELLVLKILNISSICGHSRDHRHKVRFTGTIVTDNKHTFIIDDLIHLELINHRCLQRISH